MNVKHYAARTHEEMKDVLMSPEALGPDIHYYMIRGGSEKTNITIWESGTVGQEYIKTYGHYHVGDINEEYRILEGSGVMVIQERDVNSHGAPQDDVIKTFRAFSVQAGDRIKIPSGAGHLLVNTGKTWLVTADNSPVNFGDKNPISMPGHADYEPFKRLHGAAYYIVEKNGSPALVRNENYKRVPEARIA